MNKEKLLKVTLIITMLLSLLIAIVFPLLSLLKEALNGTGELSGIEAIKYYIQRSIDSGALSNSLKISIITSILVVILAFIFAYGLTRTNMKFKGMFKSAAFIPLFAPTMMYAIGLIYWFGNKGVITQKLGLDIGIYGMLGIIISLVIFIFPQALVIIYVALNGADQRLYEAAEMSGAGPIRTFVKVTLPSVKYALFSAFLVSFTLSFTDFGAAKIVGGQCNILPLEIYKQVMGQQNFGVGAGITLVLLLPSVIFLVIEKIISKKGEDYSIGGKSIPLKIKENKVRDVVFTVYSLLIVSVFFAIVGIVLVSSLTKYWPYDLTVTLEHYKFEGSIYNETSSIISSIIISLISAILGVLIVFLNTYLIEKTKELRIIRKICYWISLIPLAVPGLVVGISYIMFFVDNGNPLNFIYGTPIILVLANLVHFYSVPFLTSQTAMKKLNTDIEETAEIMDIPTYKVLSKITFPLCRESFKENFLYYFTNSMVTISAIVFLYSPKFKVATISIVNLEDAGALAEAGAMSCLIILINIAVRVAFIIYEKIKNNLELKKCGGN
ncbi:MAG: ABC transporter permease subunit [Clostridium sp.]